MAKQLRRDTAQELQENCHAYAKHAHLESAAVSMNCTVADLLQSVVTSKCAPDCSNIADIIAEEGRATEENGQWSSILQLIALANITNSKIISVFPDVCNYARPLFHSSLYPMNATANVSQEIALMWSRCNLDNSSHVYVPDHVVPLKKK